MINIDKELEQLKIKEVEPDDRLVSQTKMRIRKILDKKTKRAPVHAKTEGKRPSVLMKWLPVALALTIVFLAVPFGILPAIEKQSGSAFYTIDINPSVELTVDDADTIISVVCKNNDALKLMAGIDCIGQNIAQAIPKIVSEAHRLGYIKDNAANYVLIARFGQSQGTVTQDKLSSLVTDAAGAQARVLYLLGTLSDKQEADAQNKSAGVMLLEKEAIKKGIDPGQYAQQDKGEIGSIIQCIDDKELPVPKISGAISGEKVRLSWNKIENAAFVGYKIVASATNENPKYPADGYIKYITDAATTALSVYEGFGGLKGGKSYYFSVTAVYEGDKYISGNTVYLKVPDIAEEPEPTTNPTDTDMKAATISGTIADGKVKLSWSKIEHASFSGYKVVKSATNPNPKYPDDGYMSYITNAGTTTASYPLSSFEPNKTYYFSVTVLYSDGTKKAGNAIALTMPEGTPVPAMTSTNITGSIDAAGKIHLSWGKIEHPNFDGYKVVYSKSPNPAYPSAAYKSWITDASTTSVTYNASDFDPASTYYFSITVLYSNPSVMKAGNDVAIVIP